MTEKIIFYVLVAIFSGSALIILWKVNERFLVEVPDRGGTLTEGIIGTPRFINPLLAISDADRDLTSLVYSGLLKATPEGDLIPDLAESYSISNDGLTYDFVLKKNISFHDGAPVTADDVEFTIQKAQDPALKSSRRANWEGVTVQKVSAQEIKFVLKQPYAPFIENLILGILPKHIWKYADSDQFTFSSYNTSPIGTGPYKIRDIRKNSGGFPVQYNLVPFTKYALGEPYISHLVIKFYSNENAIVEALRDKSIQSANSISPEDAKSLKNNGARIETSALPRIFGVFFNQNQAPIFVHHEVREALQAAVDKQKILDDVLKGYGTVIDSPIPSRILDIRATSTSAIGTSTPLERAAKILETNGWKINPDTGIREKKVKSNVEQLTFSISTSDAPELKAAAQSIASAWNTLGAHVDVKVFEAGDLNQNIIRPRKYDTLLFGEIIGRDLDLYPFWHSSQRNDPGLNIAMYANIKVDKLLEDARTISNASDRFAKYQAFNNEIKKDIPAVFTYSPDFIYIIPKSVKNMTLSNITTPSERFLDINHWYIETNKVWKIFAPEEDISQ
ncbi:hypothetical protein KW783_00290 [Candidatus Parcubacteria bacterium]|nr:hypothetical protein [Candidatus Parcubacteria bacterium]